MTLPMANLLVLRRRRGMLAAAAALTVGVPALAYLFMFLRHLDDPSNRPAGGAQSWASVHSVMVLAVIAGATVVGAAAGGGDIAAGTWRDLVATGRSRTGLVLARVPAAVIVSSAAALAGSAVSAGAAFALAGGEPTPSVTLVAQTAGFLMLMAAIVSVVAAGLAEATGSRNVATGLLLFWALAAETLVLEVAGLPGKELLLTPALDRLQPDGLYGITTTATMGTAMAVVILAAWCLAATATGAWRANRRDA